MKPAGTFEDAMTVATCPPLGSFPASSSNVTMSSPPDAKAWLSRIVGTKPASHVSAWLASQSCAAWHWFGMISE